VLHGKVTLGGNAGVEGAVISVQPAKDDDSRDVLAELVSHLFGKTGNNVATDEKGFYAVEHLAAGTYAVTATHREYAPSDPVTVTVARDQVAEVVPLVLSKGAEIAGRVLEGGKPKAGVMAQLLGAGPMQQTMTDADGRFRFQGLKLGEYSVNVVDVSGMQKGRMALKSRGVVAEAPELYELEVIFGIGKKVFGTVKGLPPAPMRMVTLRRPGGPLPEELSPLDMKAAVEANKYQVGVGFVTPDNKYEIVDIEPGTYILETVKMPDNPTDLKAYEKMDRIPHYREEITVKDEDLEHNIEIKS
jgi:hypothetical protein